MRCHVSPRYGMNDTSDCTPKMQKNDIRINIWETLFSLFLSESRAWVNGQEFHWGR